MKLPVVLVVSEDTHKLSIIKKALKNSFDLIEREDVKEALELLKHTHVDLIILDSRVKLGHNIETAEKIRAAVHRDTPILLITRNLKKSFAEVALRSGITDFINEPLDKDEIEQRIAVAMMHQDRAKKITQIARRSTPRIKSSPSLSHRAFLSDQAMQEISKARKTATAISLLMIELDDFKNIPAEKSSKAEQHLEKVLQENL